MTIRGCPVVAFDGPDLARNQVLGGEMAQRLTDAGVNAVFHHVTDGLSPLAGVEDDLFLQVFTRTIARQIEAAEFQQLMVVAQTPARALSLARTFHRTTTAPSPTLAAAERLCAAWQPYDLVVYAEGSPVIDLTKPVGHPFEYLVDMGYPTVRVPYGSLDRVLDAIDSDAALDNDLAKLLTRMNRWDT